MHFENRDQAATMLVARLAGWRGQRPLVLGLPRGGVPMARTIADRLDGDVDVVLVRKLRAPDQPELAIGAVDETGAILKGRYFDQVPPHYAAEEARRQREVIGARRARYTRARPPADAAGRLVILVDDGVATGSTMLAAIRAVRTRKPQAVIVAVAVSPRSTLQTMAAEADQVVCLYAPEDFYAVGQFFDDFSEVSDDEVVAALAKEPPPHG